MKKILALVLALSMLFCFVACSGSGDKEETTVAETTVAEETTTAADASGDTLGAVLLADFKAIVAENDKLTALEIADKVIANKAILFAGMTAEMEEGFLSGFNNEIKGFEKAACFAPSIGTIPFIGYIFTLADGADVAAFTSTLKNEANLRWNICTEAEEMVCEAVGNTVFFLMCPKSLEG